mgnify:CR=1 FL=1
MEHVGFLQLLISFLSGLVGVGVGWGALRNQVKNNTRDIVEIYSRLASIHGQNSGRSIFVPREECMERHEDMTEEVKQIKKQAEKHAKATTGLQNFARWMLIKKEGLSLIEAEKILNQGD